MPIPSSLARLELALDERSTRPVYRQIADRIREAIEAGSLAPGLRLPPIRTLAAQMGVNRDTVAGAYEALAAEGLLESVVGRGTFVLGVAGGGPSEPVALELSERVERLLAIDGARPRIDHTSEALPMHSLIPDPALYPLAEFRRSLNRAIAKGGADLFEYGGAQGHPGLREELAEHFGRSGIAVSASEIVLCHGASQGISLALRLFAREDEAVAVELPTYQNVLATLAGLGIRALGVATSAAGPDLDALARVLAKPDVKAFYTIPTFHNPLGTTTSLENRRALLELAARHGKPVIEDAFEMDLRCSGRPMPPLAALDRHAVVVHLFSFSKALFPGARVGSITARGRAVEGLVALKHATDLSDSMPLQAAMAEFMHSGAYARHLGRMRRALRARHTAAQEALARHMPAGTKWTRPEGGYQIWVELPFEIDTRDLLTDAARAGVLFSPGSQFMPESGGSRGLRLTLARLGEDEIRTGIERLARCVEARRAAAGERRAPRGVNV